MIPLAQLTYALIIELIAAFLAGFVYLKFVSKIKISAKLLGLCATTSLALTALSLSFYGGRGGMPPATVFGWPKEIIHFRPADPGYYPATTHFILSYFIADIIFYFCFCLSVFGISKLFKMRRKL